MKLTALRVTALVVWSIVAIAIGVGLTVWATVLIANNGPINI